MFNLVSRLSALFIAVFTFAGYAAAASLDFDVSEVQTKGLAILGVGVAITIAFAVYKVGKRAANKL